ncbi:MAG: phosphoribosylamine--glycine ligase [Verrucomicrobiae bacterium]|nr:phosphoribosylamine--glycine ligase [Verrucomicrobiae bacterium]
MRVLVVGNGAREHALCWRLSDYCEKLFCAPGNSGTGSLAENVTIEADDIENLLHFARDNSINLTVVGPEAPLCLGIVDRFRKAGLKIFGPTQEAARLEGDKAFTKRLLHCYHLPTAFAEIFSDCSEAKTYLSKTTFPRVIKANGLASGKGSWIVHNSSEAYAVVDRLMGEKIFGVAGETILIEEFLRGEEFSLHLLVSGKQFIILPLVRDYKRLENRDQGPNTGGMGACGPLDNVSEKELKAEIVEPLLDALEKKKIHYQGVLYVGLMKTAEGLKILELNCRFGDPEILVLAQILSGNWLEVFQNLAQGKLREKNFLQVQGFSVAVVKAMKGYPSFSQKEQRIMLPEETSGIKIFHAGTHQKQGRLFTRGGRILALSAWGATRKGAKIKVDTLINERNFDDEIYRSDIAADWLG